jgi:hypothetical protein
MIYISIIQLFILESCMMTGQSYSVTAIPAKPCVRTST